MLSRFRESTRQGRGASATELIILLVLIALVCLGVFRLFGETIKVKLLGAQAEVASVGSDDRPFEGNFDSSSSASGSSGRSSGSSTTASTQKASTGSAGGGGSIEGSRSAAKPSTAVEVAEAKPGSVGGFNPWILVIFLGLGGLLVYVFFAKKDG